MTISAPLLFSENNALSVIEVARHTKVVSPCERNLPLTTIGQPLIMPRPGHNTIPVIIDLSGTVTITDTGVIKRLNGKARPSGVSALPNTTRPCAIPTNVA